MPVVKAPLTDLYIKKLKPDCKQKKHSDGQGLYIYVRDSGSKLWQMSYRFEGKQKIISFGEYPLVTLKRAREKRDEVKRMLDEGIDPMAERKAEKEQKKQDDKDTVLPPFFGPKSKLVFL